MTLQRLEDKLDSLLLAQAAADKKLDLHIQSTTYELARIAELDLKQNEMLQEHMARSDALEEANALTRKMIADINKPKELLKLAYDVVTKLAALVGAVYIIYDKLQ